MKKSMEKLLALAIVALLSAPLAAQADEGDKPVRLPPQAKVIDDSIDELELTEEQKGKYEQIYKQHVPVLQKQFEQQQKIYTPEQKTKRKEAQTKAKEQGLKGRSRSSAKRSTRSSRLTNRKNSRSLARTRARAK
jgi:hypothetical protein